MNNVNCFLVQQKQKSLIVLLSPKLRGSYYNTYVIAPRRPSTILLAVSNPIAGQLDDEN